MSHFLAALLFILMASVTFQKIESKQPFREDFERIAEPLQELHRHKLKVCGEM